MGPGLIIGASLSPAMPSVHLLSGLEQLRAEWQKSACQAVVSWICAIGIMMLVFELWRPYVNGGRLSGCFIHAA